MPNSMLESTTGFGAIRFAAALTVTASLTMADEPDRREFRPERLVGRFLPIVTPDVLPADRVTDQVRDEELVLGVTVDNVARAYPINMLTRPTREIINDKLGGRAIAATW